MEPMYTGSYQVAKDDYTSAGHASADIKRQLKQIGVSGDVLRRVAVASYEVEMNLVIHSLGGELTLNSNKYREGVLRNNFRAWCTDRFMPVAGSCVMLRSLLLQHPFREDLRRYEDAESLFGKP